MVRLPRGFHPQAAGRTGGKLAWQPGWRQTGQQPIRRVPVGRYTHKISSVPLTGGQAQGIIPGVPALTGSVTSPTAFQLVAEVTIPLAGTYTVSWTVGLAGSTGGGDVNNFILSIDVTILAISVNAGAPGSYPQGSVTFTSPAGGVLSVFTGSGTPTTGSVYSASVPAAPGTLSLQVGPQGLGTTWYPLSVTLSTSTGALDASTALVYLGPSTTPTTLQSTVFTGNGTAALAIPSMTPGQTVIVTWTGGHPGDTAALNITGTMDAMGTG